MNNKFYFFEKTLFYICCFFSILIPLPLFLDGLTGGFLLQEISFPVVSKFPIPLGLFSFGFIFLLFYLNSFFFRNEYRLLIYNKKNRLVLFFIALFILFWAIVVSKNEILRVVQLVLPIFFLLLVAFPVNKNKIRTLLYFYLGSFFIFNLTHIFYITLNNDFFKISEYEYSLYWGYGIYQAFVSYPGVLGLFFALVSFLFFIEKNIILKFILLTFLFLIFLSLGYSARRISLFEMSLSLISLFLFISVSFFVNKGILNRNYWFSFLIMFLLFFSSSFFYFKMPIFARAVSSAKADNFDSGRLDIYSNAIDFLSSNYYFLIFGYGGKSGFHNYFLDIIYSIGLFPFLISIFSFIFLFKIKFLPSAKQISFYLLFTILGCFLLQSMLNASITQPFYLCNFMMILLVVIFYTDFNVSNGQREI